MNLAQRITKSCLRKIRFDSHILKILYLIFAICFTYLVYFILAFKINIIETSGGHDNLDDINYNDNKLVISSELIEISNHIATISKIENADDFENLKENLLGLENIIKYMSKKPYTNFAKRRKHFLNIHDESIDSPLETWQLFQNRISQYEIYSEEEEEEVLKPLLWRLSNGVIEDIVDIADQGTQIKFIIILQNSMKSLFKPQRVSREEEESMDRYYMYEKERHTGEIASYHLDRILDFRCVPPVSGRTIDMISELKNFLSRSLQKKFFYSPVNNLCFFGKCTYFCDAGHAICGNSSQLEGSMAAYVPGRSYRSQFKNPWGRSYSKYNKTVWETTENGSSYCEHVKSIPPYNSPSHLLNLIDMHIFDFLIGNKDRHHYHLFTHFGNISNFVLLDNGKGFGRYRHDIIDILAPLYQCCLIRLTTLKKLMSFLAGKESRLSSLMRKSLSKDPLENILTEGHFAALDRRVNIIIAEILKCNNIFPTKKIVIDDNFYPNRT